jgi:hypothetical protein
LTNLDPASDQRSGSASSESLLSSNGVREGTKAISGTYDPDSSLLFPSASDGCPVTSVRGARARVDVGVEVITS